MRSHHVTLEEILHPHFALQLFFGAVLGIAWVCCGVAAAIALGALMS